MYGENRVNNEINNIDADKEKDANRYVHKYINIVNDKIPLLNNVSESIDDLMGGIDVNTSNYIALKKLKDFKSHIVKLVNRFNLYIKQDTKNKDTKNTTDNTKDTITLPKTIIEKHKSELDETIKNIQIIFESFACEKFMNENFNVRSYNEKDYEISMWSINKLEKDVKTLNNIKLCDDFIMIMIMILLETQKVMENYL